MGDNGEMLTTERGRREDKTEDYGVIWGSKSKPYSVLLDEDSLTATVWVGGGDDKLRAGDVGEGATRVSGWPRRGFRTRCLAATGPSPARMRRPDQGHGVSVPSTVDP